MNILRPAIMIFMLLSLITGIMYPLAITGIGQALMKDPANGSIINKDGKVLGSHLIGQDFSGDGKYFWGRPSATAPVPYTSFNADAAAGSTGSNLGPTNQALLDNVKSRIDALKAADTAAGYVRPANQKIPVDLVTASGSGLDPHISLAAAEYQLPRIAKARNMSEAQLRAFIENHTSRRQLGILGEPVVNVLNVNLELSASKR